eukprot:COSAG01_NODE_7373_length_3232_cov_4.371360_4_plen_88_part_00
MASLSQLDHCAAQQLLPACWAGERNLPAAAGKDYFLQQWPWGHDGAGLAAETKIQCVTYSCAYTFATNCTTVLYSYSAQEGQGRNQA